MEILKGHCVKINKIATRQTKTGRRIKAITCENVPYPVEIWDNDSVFNELEENRFLCVIEGLLYEKSTDYDTVMSPKKDSVLRVSITPIGRVWTAQQTQPESQIPKSFAADINTPLLNVISELTNELRLIRQILQEKLRFNEPKLEDNVEE